MRCLDCPPLLDLPQNKEHHRLVDLGDRHSADRWKDIVLEARDHVIGVNRCPPILLQLKPVARYDLERIRGRELTLDGSLLDFEGGILAFCEPTPRLGLAITGSFQRDVGVGAEISRRSLPPNRYLKRQLRCPVVVT
jgi:hypothetical protein